MDCMLILSFLFLEERLDTVSRCCCLCWYRLAVAPTEPPAWIGDCFPGVRCLDIARALAAAGWQIVG